MVEARPHRTWVEISRSRIASNFQAIRAAVGTAVEIMPVVKADAYRHGSIEVSRTLVAAGARWLAVSNTEEGIVLRDAGIAARILVMADFLPFAREPMLLHALTPVIHSLDDLVALDRLAASHGKRLTYHLKIDTGMGRLGVRAAAPAIAEAILNAHHVELEGVMTHFASAGNYDSDQTAQQSRTFAGIVDALAAAGIHPRYVHLSSTIPVAYGSRETWNPLSRLTPTIMVRPGHAIYGYVSPARGNAPPQIVDVQPALTWRASVLAVKDLPAGALVGYGGIYCTPQAMRIAVLAVGYADGLPHRLSNRGSVIAHGRIVPILGAVSMDLTTIDVTDVPHLAVGDPVTLLGAEGDISIDAQQIARVAGTISYSVLCGIHARVKRIYI